MVPNSLKLSLENFVQNFKIEPIYQKIAERRDIGI